MDWLRLWHDMPNDPKWRTISRASSRPIAEVMAIYCHLLVMASSNPDRGYVPGVTSHDMSHENVTNVTFVTGHEINFVEGLSTALDLDIEHVESILVAMQGRVLLGARMSGWEGRQPRREDAGGNESGPKSSAQRKREERERKKAASQNGPCHDASHTVTQSHDREEKIRGDIKDTPPPAYMHDEFDPRIKFAMHPTWQPNERSFAAVLTMNAMAGQVFDQAQLLEFRSFWTASPDEHRTQAKWEHALAQNLKRDLRNAQAAGSTHHASQQHGTSQNSQGDSGNSAQARNPRPAQQGPLSAPDRVRAAIAERDAQEGLAGQALDQDD